MKKLNKHISREYSPVVLYLEDLEDIERVLRDNAKNLAITYGDYQYDSVSELVGGVGAKQIRGVEMKAQDPYTTIELKHFWTKVYISDSETTAAGVFYQLDEIILRCRRWFPWIYRPFLSSIIVIFIMLAGAGVILLVDKPELNIQNYFFPPFFVVFIWSGWINMGRHATVWLTKKPSSFIARNRDQLILAFASGLIGAIFGFLLGHVDKLFFK